MSAHQQNAERSNESSPEGEIEISIEEVVRLATVFSKIMSGEDGEMSSSEIRRLNDAGMVPIMFATRNLIEGRRYAVTTDNPQIVERLRSLAEHLGASVAELRTEDSFARIVIDPPSRN